MNEVHFRKLKQIDLSTFRADIASSELCKGSWSSIDELAKCYDVTLSGILDKHAPLKTKVMVVRSKVPWFNSDLKQLKAKRRKLERTMLKSGLQCDKDAYRNIRDDYSARLNDARKAHYSDLIHQCSGNSRKLFHVINSLSKEQQNNPLPPHDNPRLLADNFGEFFYKKIELIKNEIDNIQSTHRKWIFAHLVSH